MRKTRLCIFLFYVFISNGLCFRIEASSVDLEPTVEIGVQKYHEALQTREMEEKTALLNEALSIYLEHAKRDPSWRLLSNIGDVYYSFGRYGYSIGYYRRALVLQPGDRAVKHNLQVAIKTAQVENEQISDPFFEFVGSLGWTLNEWGIVALGLILITFVVFSLDVWFPSLGFSVPWKLGFLCTIICVGPMLVALVFKPVTAVVLRASPLRDFTVLQGSGTGISLDPGQMVYVESCDALSGYVQVKTASGVRGDLPKEDLMFIE